jgi:ferredoxin
VQARIDPSRCQGHTLRAMIAPESFELDDLNGHAHAIVEDVPDHRCDAVLEAVNSCSEQAITTTIERFADAPAVHGQRQET